MLALWHTRTHTNTTPSTSGVQTKPSFVTYPLLYFTTNFCESTFSMSSLPARSRVGGSLWHSSLLDPLSSLRLASYLCSVRFGPTWTFSLWPVPHLKSSSVSYMYVCSSPLYISIYGAHVFLRSDTPSVRATAVTHHIVIAMSDDILPLHFLVDEMIEDFCLR